MDVLIIVATLFFNLVEHKLMLPLVEYYLSFDVCCLENILALYYYDDIW